MSKYGLFIFNWTEVINIKEIKRENERPDLWWNNNEKQTWQTVTNHKYRITGFWDLAFCFVFCEFNKKVSVCCVSRWQWIHVSTVFNLVCLMVRNETKISLLLYDAVSPSKTCILLQHNACNYGGTGTWPFRSTCTRPWLCCVVL